MTPRLMTGMAVVVATIATASTLDSGLLAPYVRAMQAAEGFDVKYSVSVVGGALSEYRVVLSRPNKAMMDSPTATVFADGTSLTTFNKASNSYTVKQQSASTIGSLLSGEHFSLWLPYFDATVFDAVASTKNDGTRVRKGETLNIVSAQLDTFGRNAVRLHLSQKDNIIRQAELTVTTGLTAATSILSVDSVSTAKPADSVFTFVPRANSKLITEREERIAEYRKLVSVAKTERTKATGGVLTYLPVQPSNEHFVAPYIELFLNEFSKYPLAFIKSIGIKRVVFVEKIAVEGQIRSGAPMSHKDEETLYLNVTYMSNEPYCRGLVHHEFFHMIDEEWLGKTYRDDPEWAALNGPGFIDGPGGKFALNTPGDKLSYVHPRKGFLNLYSTYGVEEDKAEIWSMMFVPEKFELARPLIESDSTLQSKVAFLRARARSKCPEMDDAFWKQVAGDPQALSSNLWTQNRRLASAVPGNGQ